MTDPSVDNGRRTGRETGNGDKCDVAGTTAGGCSMPSSLGGLKRENVKTDVTRYTVLSITYLEGEPS